MKVFARIETAESVKNIHEVLHEADGLIISVDEIQPYLTKNKMDVFSIIAASKKLGKPVFIHYVYGVE
jgi:pyruvate kinase